jgi:peptide-methionine (S)-S-oxide reductase
MTEKAIFGAGCFWGVEAAFRKIEGVVEATSGYSGGRTEEPSYGDVCSGATGHAEVVEVEYDPEKVSYEELLEVFWKEHDPTQVNRQGLDMGTQYRSAIFYTTPEQEAAAHASREKAQERYRKPIATEIAPASEFYRAEEYHQRYFEKNRLARFFSF